MIKPLPERVGGDRPYVTFEPKRRTPRPNPQVHPGASTLLAELLRTNASLATIRDQLLSGRSYSVARDAIVKCAASDEFSQALTEAFPEPLSTAAASCLDAWRDQDQRMANSDRFRSLREMLVQFERLSSILRMFRSAAAQATPDQQAEGE
jgi:hypothetical protein